MIQRSRAVTVLVAAFAGLLLLTGQAHAATVVEAPRDARAVNPEVSVRLANWGMEMHLKFNAKETHKIGQAANTGFLPFMGSLCGLIPGGVRTWPIKSACVVGLSVQYGRLKPLFQQADRQGKCMIVSYPIAFPFPNPPPFSKVSSC